MPRGGSVLDSYIAINLLFLIGLCIRAEDLIKLQQRTEIGPNLIVDTKEPCGPYNPTSVDHRNWKCLRAMKQLIDGCDTNS